MQQLMIAAVMSVAAVPALASGTALVEPGPTTTTQGHERTIVETAVATEGLSTLVAALKAADLVGALSGEGPFTVFAPTDEAFAALPHGVLESLLKPENRDALTSILTYHVGPGALDAAAVSGASRVATLNGQSVPVRLEDGAPIVGGASVIVADVRCSNGVVHLIDQVLIPNDQNIVELAAGAGTFGTLLKAATAAGLADTLSNGGPFTVFAPTDEAFAALPKGALEALLQPRNRNRLAAVLKYHVVPGRVFADQAASAGAAKTLQGESVRAAIRGGRLTIDGATVLTNDLQTTNGVVHVIDRVLMPEELPEPAPNGRLVVGVYPGDVSAALAAQLGIDRNKAFLIDSLVKGGNAEAAGVQKFDVVIEVDGKPAVDGELDRAKQRAGYGNPVALTILRRAERITIHVPVGVERH